MLTLDNEKIILKEKQKQNKTHFFFFTLNPMYLEREKVRTPTYGKIIGFFSPPSSSFYNYKGGDIVDNVLLSYWTMCCFLIGQGQC